MIRPTAIACLLMLFGLAASSPAAEKELVRFDEQFDPATVHTRDAQISRSGDRLRLALGHNTQWPGIDLRPPGDGWDLSPFGHVVVDVKNLGDRAVQVGCRIDDRESATAGKWLDERISLAPGQRKSLQVTLRKRLGEELGGKLFGMRGYPGGWTQRRGIDVSRVVRLNIYVPRPSEDHLLEIGGVLAGGRPANPMPDADKLFPMIDRFGQYMHKDWPGKTHSAEDLAAREKQEAAELDEHPGPKGWNQYGGWAAGPKLEATGRFRVEKHKGKWWLVDPEGRLFWSHGSDCVRATTAHTPITDREHYFADMPARDSPFGQFYGKADWAPHGYYQGKQYETYNFTGANLLRKYGDDWRKRSAALAHRRLRSWGMNTIANWSDPGIYLQRKTTYTVNIRAGGRKIEGSQGYWGRFPDPFDPGFKATLQESLQQEKGKSIGDPWCLGCFINNELSWGNDTSLAAAALASPADQPAKQVFVDDLKRKYETIERLNAAWGTGHESWDALLRETAPPAVDKARADLEAFYTRIAEQYFRTCRDAVKQADGQMLYLGCRFAWVNDRAARAAGKFCDVVSYNRYRRSVADLRPAEGVDRPLVIGEFHFGALDRGMLHTGLVPCRDQQERAEAYKSYVQGAIENPWIVGTHWFQFGDQATTGRGDGENYQIGLLDVCDTPYGEIVEACRAVGYDMYRHRLERKENEND